MADIAQLGIEVDFSDVDAAGNALNELASDASKAESATKGVTTSSKKQATQTKKTTNALKQQAVATKKVSTETRSLRFAAGQLGFQVQDIAVQLQSGQNALLVFGQQGSQIASIFGPTGAVVGAIAAVGAAIGSALIPALMGASTDTEELTERIEDLTDGFRNLTQEQTAFLILEYRRQIEAATERQDELNEAISETSTELKGADENVKFYGRSADTAQRLFLEKTQDSKEGLIELQAELATTTGEIAKFEEAIAKLEAGTFGQDDGRAQSAAKTRAAALQAELNQRRFTSQEELEILRSLDAEEEKLRQQDLERERVWLAEKRMQREMSLQAELDSINAYWGAVEEGRQRDNLANAESLQAQLNQRRTAGQEELDALAAFDEQRKQSQNKFYGDLATIVGTGLESLFGIQKGAAISTAIVDGIGSAVASFKAGAAIGGPVLGGIYAGASALATGAQISQMVGTSFGSTSTPSAAPSVSVPDAQQQAVTNNTTNAQVTVNVANGEGAVEAIQSFFDDDGQFTNAGFSNG